MNWKARIKESFTGKLLISYFHCFESFVIPHLWNDETAVKRFFRDTAGYELDLDNPMTFSEKMNWYKLNGRIPLMEQCADKVGVREYIKKCGYVNNLNRIYGVYNSAREIRFSELPDCYVLKASHGSHMNIIKEPGMELDERKARAIMQSWLHQNIYWGGREWVYKNIPRRIIAEEFLVDVTGELRDYKFFCFNGNPCYLQYDGGRFKGKHFRNYYDMDYNLLKLHDDVQNNPEEVLPLQKKELDEMKQMASVLSQPFQFVRVDFYYVKGRIYIGELTFFHNGGFTWFTPSEYDLEFGKKWRLID